MFKDDFLWSASTSAYQIEGAYNEDGKGLSVQDVKEIIKGTPDFKICSDHYHRYKEDVKLLSELGLKAYRFSIAWTRIIPNGIGEVNQKGIEFYSNLINELLKYNIVPIITMYHFDLPYELEKIGGWSNRKTIDAFVEFARVLFENFGDRVKYWLTINEQNMMILHSQAISGKEDVLDKYQQNHHMLIAQAKAMNLCHEMLKEAKIGPAPNIAVIYPKTCKPEDNLAAQYANVHRNWLYLDAYVFGKYNHLALKYIKDKGYELKIEDGDYEILKQSKPDFIAINYYNTMTVSKTLNENLDKLDNALVEENFYATSLNENLKITQFGWEVDPMGFEITLNEVYSRYKLPILVTENGLGACDKLEENNEIHDDYRIEYLKEHIESMKRAYDSGVEIIGYSPWSAIDLISTHQGFEKRYGFIYVNRNNEDIKDLARYKKDSFYWYKKVIETNGENLSN